jgi:hypothetical protein
MIIPTSLIMWMFADRIPIIRPLFYPLTLIPALVGLVILIYAFLARRTAWVQCRSGHLRIQTPILPLAVAYSRIKAVRPATLSQIFDPQKQRAGRRRWLQPYWGRTAVVVELSKFPVAKPWLRLWFSPTMFAPNVTGLVFLVEDWMALSRQIDDSRTTWERRRAERRRQMMEA